MQHKKNILVAPLNWGLGHATRCIPIINALLAEGYNPILASDGVALELLRKEFPKLTWITLPSYNITYTKKGKWFKLKFIAHIPSLIKVIYAEKKATKKLVQNYSLTGIISDNRLGVRNKKTPSVFITHQLTVLSGNTTWLSSKIHLLFIKKFNACWVPDVKETPNLSGILGHPSKSLKVTYINPISRFNTATTTIKYSILVLISGPEPQRSLLEEKLITLFSTYKELVLLVCGKIEAIQTVKTINNLTIYNYMTGQQLEKTVLESDLIISRSGYTTVMDLAKLKKKAFFIPTPGQFEQEYLAHYLDQQKLVPSCSQDAFSIEQLKRVDLYSGLTKVEFPDPTFKTLFSLFEGE